MRLPTLLPLLLAPLTLADITHVIIKNHLSTPIYVTHVDQATRSATSMIAPGAQWMEQQTTIPGVALKITPGENDIDIGGKGVLTLAYTYSPDWLYYDLGVHIYYPFEGHKANLTGKGGDFVWEDGRAHEARTVGYNGQTDLTLVMG